MAALSESTTRSVVCPRPDGNSDHTGCRLPLANQVRLALRTGAYWLLLKVRDDIPQTQTQPPAVSEFKTMQMCLIKITAHITETTKRIRVAFAAVCPEGDLLIGLVRRFQRAGP